MNSQLGKIFFIASLFFSTQALAATYNLPSNNEALIGKMQSAVVNSSDTTATVAQNYDLGYNSIEDANAEFNPSRLPKGSELKIPTYHLLPSLPRKGIIINLSEMRMYYFPKGSNKVMTYPIGIGKIGKTIPIAETNVIKKKKDPIWIPPEDIRQFNMDQGVILPRIMPPGPDNPLGPYAIYLGLPTYLIHSTIFPESVGRRASFGCIRMYKSDIESFFPTIEKGVPVVITTNTVKIGWQDNKLYMESHYPLEEHGDETDTSLSGVVDLINQTSSQKLPLINWELVSYLAKVRDGIPHPIGFSAPN